MLLSGVLLIVVLGAGVTVNGARRWLPVGGGFTLQPSELAKVALCVFAAWSLSTGAAGRPPACATRSCRSARSPLALLLLVMAGSDLGSALCLVLVGRRGARRLRHARAACSGASRPSQAAASC